MDKNYLISYFFCKDNGKSGFDNAFISEKSNEDIYTSKGVRAIKNKIAKEANLVDCVITNIIPLHS